MKLSKKTYYGLRAILTLAQAKTSLSIHAIAKKEHLPEDYLEKIFQKLRKAGIVEAKKGVEGGYLLARPAQKISAWDVIRELDGPLRTFSLFTRGELPCLNVSHCQTNEVLRKFENEIERSLSKITLASLI
ncbi:MAG: Rrf2 family transcriptional regulator [Candidatus Moranbacteria bacterium]|nr:Rrf2 family transcriptional regulator [Candidatus Moranbacteria bacterium]